MNTEKRDFDKEAASWDEHPARVKLAKNIAHALSKQTVLTSDMNALDFGCGTGLLTIQLHPLVHSITGIDSSQGMLDIFNTKVAKLKLTNIRPSGLTYSPVRARLLSLLAGVLPPNLTWVFFTNSGAEANDARKARPRLMPSVQREDESKI